LHVSDAPVILPANAAGTAEIFVAGPAVPAEPAEPDNPASPVQVYRPVLQG